MKAKIQIEKIDITVWLFISLYIIFFSLISFFRYYSFDYVDMDLAAYSQIMWNIIHGSAQSSVLGINFLGHHAHFILFLIAPIFFLFPHPLTLLLLQTICLSTAALPIYLIAKKELNAKFGLAIVIIYLLYPALGYINSYEFHVPVLATLFLSFMFYFFNKNNFRLFFSFMFLSLLCQENVALLIIPFGIYALCIKRQRRWAGIAVTFSAIWFIVVVGTILPYFNKGIINFWVIYEYLGSSPAQILKTIITKPATIWKIVTVGEKINYIFQLLVPLSFFSLLDPSAFIFSLTLFLHLISSRPHEHAIYYHYSTGMIPFIFISAIYGIKRFFSNPFVKKQVHQNIFILFLLSVVVTSSICFGPIIELIYNSQDLKIDAWDYQRKKFIASIPKQASVVATFEFLPFLSLRSKLYSFHHIVHGFYTLSRHPYRLPAEVEYALLDFNDPLGFDAFFIRGRSEVNVINFMQNNDWSTVDMLGSVVLLKKNGKKRNNLFKHLRHLPPISNIVGKKISKELEFLGYDIKGIKDIGRGEKVEFVFYWKALKKMDKEYWNLVEFIDKNGKILYYSIKPICYRIFPTYLWQNVGLVKENYNLFIPEDVQRLNYDIIIKIAEAKDIRSIVNKLAARNEKKRNDVMLETILIKGKIADERDYM